MRRIELKSLVFEADEILTRKQLKNMIGGSGGSAFCEAKCTCPNGIILTVPSICSGTCNATDEVGVSCTGLGGTTTHSCSDAMSMCP